jgi:hypothetical protein
MVKSISLANFFTAISIPASNIRKDHAETIQPNRPDTFPSCSIRTRRTVSGISKLLEEKSAMPLGERSRDQTDRLVKSAVWASLRHDMLRQGNFGSRLHAEDRTVRFLGDRLTARDRDVHRQMWAQGRSEAIPAAKALF